ncbi:Hypothetical protein RMHFA_00745 [Roseomonas mucosa]|uniref:hypothetical protein n=1 Tax=Roseomonas TaxID=125216 RepID=UPI00095CA701|nr:MULTISPECIES: hypothetical protein [Roseomonas]ATR21804.1 hypothetical protein CTJ15_16850 [Roseomonas sp. FDAARGOS_362]USQ70013.1 hypothetical protein NF552_10440 [Roseomonas mucosa]UZO95750.1 Hypothetical protein RMHFA_00745 [Roseomonas mucosa]GAV34550.1 hypothetical protein ROTAS13_02218 [Roseomonas sp. TAS13]
MRPSAQPSAHPAPSAGFATRIAHRAWAGAGLPAARRLTPLALLLLPFLVAALPPGEARAQSSAPQAQPPQTHAQPRPEPGAEEIGSWILTCAADRMTDQTSCRLLNRRPAVPASAGQAALTLEVVRRNGRLVPAVTARDLTIEGIGRGLLAFTGTAQLRFPPNRFFEMPCGLEGRSVVCAPKAEDVERAATELPAAERALVRIVGLVPEESESTEPTELRLSRTGEALARFRARAPEGPGTAEASPGFDLREMLGRLMRFLNP